MAQGRFVSKSISANEELANVSWQAAFLFTWCLPHLDAEGRLTGNPALIKSQVCPLRAEIEIQRIPSLLEELADAQDEDGQPLVVRYQLGGKQFLFFPGFEGQQPGLRKDREAASRIPAPDAPGVVIVAPAGWRRDGGTNSGPTPAQLRTYSGPTPAQEEGEEEVEGEVQGEVQVEEEASRSAAAARRPPTPAPAREEASPPADSTAAADGSKESSIAEMRGDLSAFLKRHVPTSKARKRFGAAAGPLVLGDASGTWLDPRNGGADQVPWAERPSLLRAALAKCAAEERLGTGDLESTLRYVIRRQLDPLPARSRNGTPAAQITEELPGRERTARSDIIPIGAQRPPPDDGEEARRIAEWAAEHRDEAEALRQGITAELVAVPGAEHLPPALLKAQAASKYRERVLERLAVGSAGPTGGGP